MKEKQKPNSHRNRLTCGNRRKCKRLLDLNFGASCFDFFLDVFSFFLSDTFFDGLRSSFNEVFSFFEAEAGDSTDFFNDANFVRACFLEDNIKRGLLFSNRSSSSTCTSSCNSGNGSSGGNAPLVFKFLYKFCSLKNGQTAQLLNDNT